MDQRFPKDLLFRRVQHLHLFRGVPDYRYHLRFLMDPLCRMVRGHH
jgi:hypothetical protein